MCQYVCTCAIDNLQCVTFEKEFICVAPKYPLRVCCMVIPRNMRDSKTRCILKKYHAMWVATFKKMLTIMTC